MKKYIIEGEVNFYEELNNSLKSDLIIQEKCCLITNEPLTDKYVELVCGHFFNYIPLWKEIYNHKFSSSFYKDLKNSKIKDKIECPYCRNIESPLLPYYPEFGFKLAYGITSSEEQYKLILNNNKLVYENTLHYSTGICNYTHEDKEICNNIYVLFHDGLNKTFCSKHLTIIKHQYNKEQKIKAKMLLKEQKLQEKMLLKEQKLQEKMLIKEHKMVKDENVILSSKIIITNEFTLNTDTCIYVFKKGINKNKQCNCKISNDNLCKRHYKI